MVGLGTLINVGLLIAGGLIGLIFKRFVGESLKKSLISACGVTVLFLGIGGTLEKMLVYEDGAFSTQGGMMLIISVAAGTIIGELLRIDALITRFGEWLKAKTGSEKDQKFVSAFVDASCTVCIGAMAIIGSMMDAIFRDYSILFAKGLLDAVIICVMCASVGKGAVFSAIPVLIFQGAVTAAAYFAGSFIPDKSVENIAYVGSVLIFCVGLNLIRDKQIKVANMLPSLIICAFWP